MRKANVVLHHLPSRKIRIFSAHPRDLKRYTILPRNAAVLTHGCLFPHP